MEELPEREPLHDVIAAQGIMVIVIAIGVVVLNIFAPEYCAALLAELRGIAERSPSLESLLQSVTEWFASIFAA
ncbi:MAG TPA: hypothetical protein DCP68_03515 [Ruminococcus sp.]|nr:hypothetical protein [Ruminococcus sp.]